jgi:hypothetical protein
MAESARTTQEISREIIERLDIAAEYEALGVRLRGEPRASGMISAYAYGRDDHSPSAFVNSRTGIYGDSGGKSAAAYVMGLFDFAVHVGRFPDWKAARAAFSEKAGVKIGREKKAKSDDKTDWRKKLEMQSWETTGNNILADRWCMKVKPGVTVEAIKAAGGQMAYYPCFVDKKTGEKKKHRGCKQVIALPCYGIWFLEADPVAWVIWDISGADFDVTPKDTPPTEPRQMAKMLSVGPTAHTLMGLSSLMMLCDPERRAGVRIVFKVEGPADMLALWAVVPEAERETVAVVTAAGGATSDVAPHQAKILAGLTVAVVPDRDTAGMVGAEKWCRALDGLTTQTMVVDLPWGVAPSHGYDLRDFLNGAKTSQDSR